MQIQDHCNWELNVPMSKFHEITLTRIVIVEKEKPAS